MLEMWPSVMQTDYSPGNVGTVMILGNRAARAYRIEVAYGDDRPPHCTAKHPVVAGGHRAVCAAWVGHDGPHIAASVEYMDEVKFTIIGMTSGAPIPSRLE